MSEEKIKRFSGKELTVSWDARLCIGIAECGRSDDTLFVADRDPWCQPDDVEPARVVEVCARCPSGALSVTDRSGADVEPPADGNRVYVAHDGPLFVHGKLALQHAADDMPGIRHRVALCRCGKSSNKPFCDNSHRDGFSDAGAIGEDGPGYVNADAELHINPTLHGPLVLEGPVQLVTGSGRVAWRGNNVALCRCGESANKPFCDGSHQKAGFRSE